MFIFKIIENVMYSKQAYNSLIYNPQERSRRPQTPLGTKNNNNSYSQINYNKSFSKNMPVSPHYSQNNNMGVRGQQISKSRVSVNSSVSQLEFLNADGGQIFPEDLIFLLKNQEKNINNFKQKIEKQKTRVQNDFAILKTQIQHTLQDLKLSFQAQLDLVYKTFITKYAQVKGEVQQIRRLRKQILIANNTASSHIPVHKDSTSNSDIVSEIQKDAEHFRNYRVYSYLTEMQKQRINPILQLCSQIILIGSADCPFYRSKEMSIKAKIIKSAFSGSLADVFENIQDYIVSPEAIIQKQRQEQQNANMVLQNFQNQQNYPREVFGVNYPQNRPSPPKFQFDIPKKSSVRPASHGYKQESFSKNNQGPKNRLSFIDQSEKVSVTRWADNISLKKVQKVQTDHSDAILCMFFIDDKYIATGSKDKTINVYSFQGKKVTTLRGHDAAICTLSTVKNSNGLTYLASGSDHGCCCLILWDTRSWTISSRIQSHSAAVTCIVDLGDGQHLVTGSYDKQINLFNHWKGQILSTYNNKSNVTSIILTSDKRRLVSACLQNSLIVWNIVRMNNQVSIQIQNTISNDSFVCILQSSILRPEIVYGATRKGKIKVFNLNRQGRAEKTLTVNQNSIIELAVLQREMKPEGPLIFSCSSKDKSLCMTKLDSGLSQLIKINGAFNVEFGCGIGPKIIFANRNSGMMGILSQSSAAREFSLFDIQLK